MSIVHVLWLEVGEYYEALESFPCGVFGTAIEAAAERQRLTALTVATRERREQIGDSIDLDATYADAQVLERLAGVAQRFGWRERDLAVVQAALATERLAFSIKPAPYAS